jgi:hypothetical protein
MKKIAGYFDKVRVPDWSIPFALLGVCLLAFGPFITKLGFYQDDWHFVYYAYTRGAAGLIELLNFDGHPMAGLTYAASFNLLGVNPVYWQIYSLFWRWLAVAAFWLVLHRTWPQHRIITFSAAAIYVIYPLYAMQPMAVVYFEVWISHLVLAISFLFTIEAIKQPKRFWLFTALAIAFKLLHALTSEYTWGMELARPVLIWLALPNESLRQRLSKTIQIYAPYLLIFVLMVAWRGFLYRSPVLERSDPRLFGAILTDPIGGIKRLLLDSIPDLVLILVSAWFETLKPQMFALKEKFNLQVIGLIIASTAGLGIYLSKLAKAENENSQRDAPWRWEMFFFGAMILVFGMIPSYAAGYFVTQKLAPWNGRFVIGSMPGIALLTALFIASLVDAPKKRLLTIALIISLGIGWQVRTSNKFRWAWKAETDFYHQLILRAPSIAPKTAFLAKDEFLGLMGDYPTAFALNTLYAEPLSATTHEARTWLFVVDSNFGGRVDGLLSGMPLQDEKHSIKFSGKSSDSLIIRYEPDLGECMWLLTPEDASVQIIPQTLRTISPLSNPSLIDPSAAPPPFLQDILPPQPENWCAYYQRGALAFQTKEFEKVVSLWETATKKGFRPANGFELLPFIESQGLTGNWQKAFELTRDSNKLSRSMENALCAAWSRMQAQTVSSPEREEATMKVKDYLGCR